jgi:hypothetical protein
MRWSTKLLFTGAIVTLILTLPVSQPTTMAQGGNRLTGVWIYITTACANDSGTDSDFRFEFYRSNRLAAVFNTPNYSWDENNDCRTERYYFQTNGNTILYDSDFANRSNICMIMLGSDAWRINHIMMLGRLGNGNVTFLLSSPYGRDNWVASSDRSEGEPEIDMAGGTCPAR